MRVSNSLAGPLLLLAVAAACLSSAQGGVATAAPRTQHAPAAAASIGSAVMASGRPSRPRATPVTALPALSTTERTVEHHDGKLVLIHKPRSKSPGRGRGAHPATTKPPPDANTILIQAPRRFVPQREPVTCGDGYTPDHRGKCREDW